MENGVPRLTIELLQQVLGNGRHWLTQLAEDSQLKSELRALRRLTWHVLLGVVTGDKPEQWAEELDRHRERYSSHVEDLKRETDVKAVDPKFSNPLSRHVSNPFVKLQANEQLLAEIWKDVERTFPENQLLSNPESRSAMQRILFHWCRVNNPADVAAESYRQGMNELIAVVWFIVRQGEYFEEASVDYQDLAVRLCGRRHNEADAFALFERVMQAGLRPMFVASGASLAAGRPTKSPVGELPRSRVATHPGDQVSGPSSPILARCSFISDVALKLFDEKLYKHLQKMEIEPQIFLLRWLRLLFCREFCLEDTVLLWDALFADALQPAPPASLRYPPAKGGPPFVAVMKEASAASAALPLVDYLAVALLCSFRGDLLNSDQTDCLRRLMSGPAMQQGGDAQDLIEVAKRLRAEGKPLIPEPQSFTMADSDDSDTEEAMTPTTSMENELPVNQATSMTAAHATPPLAATLRPARQEAPMEIPPQAQQLFNAAAQQAQGLLDAGRQALALAGQKVPLLKPQQATVGNSASNADAAHGLGSAGQAVVAARAGKLAGTSREVPRSEREGMKFAGDQPPASVEAFLGGSPSSTISDLDAAAEMAELRRRVAAAEHERDNIKRKANEFYLMKKGEWAAQMKIVQSQLAMRDARIAELDQQLIAGKEEAVQQRQRICALEQELSMTKAQTVESTHAKMEDSETVPSKESLAATPSTDAPAMDSAKADEEF